MTCSTENSKQNLGYHSLQKDFSIPLKTCVTCVALTTKQNRIKQNSTQKKKQNIKTANFRGKGISLRWQNGKVQEEICS